MTTKTATPNKCKVRQYSDRMSCVCGAQWDVNDPDPPPCRDSERKLVDAARTYRWYSWVRTG